jgi:flagellar protein FlgJ
MRTLEYVQGGSYNVVAPFRAYKSLADSVADHARLFASFPAYRPALEVVGDADEFARRIARAGYATDPDYAQKLIELMRRYDLYRLDAAVAPSPLTT